MESMREQLAAAWDKAEQDNPEPEAIEEVESFAPEPEEPTEEIEATEQAEKPEAPVKAETKPEKPEKPEKATAAPTAPKPETAEKAPGGWSPTAKEQWNKLPTAVKREVQKREQEIDVAMKKTALARRAMEQFNATLAPYQQGMIASGYSDPFQAIGNILATEASLRQGTAAQKASTLARLATDYGVDFEMLDNALAGRVRPQQQQQQNRNPDLESLIDQRMAPVNQFLQRIQAQEQMQVQQSQYQANQSVAEFSQNAEFINEVRLDMADMIDAAARRQQPLTLQQAYERACAIHPEINKIMTERAAQQRLMGTQQLTRAKKNAASASLTGRPAGASVGNGGGMNLREQIEAAWNEQVG